MDETKISQFPAGNKDHDDPTEYAEGLQGGKGL